MATQAFTLLPNIWQRITDKGQSGTLWTKSVSQYSVLIDHVNVSGAPEDSFAEGSEMEASVGISIKKSFVVPTIDPITIPADSVDDVYYALYRSTDPEKSAITVVDVL